MGTRETGRTLSIVGGVLLFVGLIFSSIFISAIVSLPSGGAMWIIPPFLSLIIGIGVLLDIVCGIILILVRDAAILLVAGDNWTFILSNSHRRNNRRNWRNTGNHRGSPLPIRSLRNNANWHADSKRFSEEVP